MKSARTKLVGALLIAGLFLFSCRQDRHQGAQPTTTMAPAAKQEDRTADQIAQMNQTCVACHTSTDSHTMHESPARASCVDCHGGHSDVNVPPGLATNSL